MSVLKLEKLTKYYGKNRGIESVSLEIQKGEIFGFIGPNGAGKSTTIRSALGLLKPTSGTVRFFDKEFSKHREEILENIGYLPSEGAYYEQMKAKDFLLYAGSFYQQFQSSEMMRLAQLFDLDLNKRIRDLSLGNKKKVGIIQAMQHDPQLLIFDEPTSGLDPLVQQQFFNELKRLRDEGKSILFSSHVLSEVERICDRIGIIKDGKLISVSRLDALYTSQYYQVQISLHTDAFSPPKELDIASLNQDENRYQFIYQGNVNALIAYIATLNIEKLHIQEPDLETIFMHYYKNE